MTAKANAGPPGMDRDLGMLSDGLRALRDLAADPKGASDGARVYDFSIRWGVLISGQLERAEHYHRAGGLTEGQEQRYRELKRGLRDATPQIERLGIGRPAVPLEDQEAPAGAQERTGKG